MKGTLVKRNTGDWVVWWTDSTAKNGVRMLPLIDNGHIDGLKLYDSNEGLEVEFEIAANEAEPLGRGEQPYKQYAKLIDDDLSDWDVTLTDGLEKIEWDTKQAQSPKDKAKELIVKMSTHDRDIHPHCTHYIAKQCALIAAEETIRTLNEDIRDLDVRGNILLDLIEYWREVKQEIEKL